MAKDGGFVSTSSAGLLDYVNGENTFYRRGCFLRSYDKEEEEDVKRWGERKLPHFDLCCLLAWFPGLLDILKSYVLYHAYDCTNFYGNLKEASYLLGYICFFFVPITKSRQWKWAYSICIYRHRQIEMWQTVTA